MNVLYRMYVCVLIFALGGMDSNAQGGDDAIRVAIYYRWNKYHLDSAYLSNPEQLTTLDSLLTSTAMQRMDTVTIVAYASPEGHPDYNMWLSGQRANTIRNYILAKYPQIEPYKVVTIARGENWEGLLKFALNDYELPSRGKVLEIITSSKSKEQKQLELTELDGGKTYYRYILPNYYRYLRNGASVFIAYRPELPTLGNLPFPLVPPLGVEPPLMLEPVSVRLSEIRIGYPIALRTNLLYDVVGALNIGVELPLGIGQNWSIMADIAYSYWRSSRNLYALQTLEYGAELRYWFPVGEQRKNQNPNWAQPLKGFYLGGYGRYYQRYDVQFIDGYQGDGSWSAGLTAGYAIPLNNYLSLDLGIGAGWFSTSQYRHYHQPEYDKNGKYHLMWQETGSWSGLSLTKVRLSLVWLLQKQITQKGGTVR